jgi:hypothetical protein
MTNALSLARLTALGSAEACLQMGLVLHLSRWPCRKRLPFALLPSLGQIDWFAPFHDSSASQLTADETALPLGLSLKSSAFGRPTGVFFHRKAIRTTLQDRPKQKYSILQDIFEADVLVGAACETGRLWTGFNILVMGHVSHNIPRYIWLGPLSESSRGGYRFIRPTTESHTSRTR